MNSEVKNTPPPPQGLGFFGFFCLSRFLGMSLAPTFNNDATCLIGADDVVYILKCNTLS